MMIDLYSPPSIIQPSPQKLLHASRLPAPYVVRLPEHLAAIPGLGSALKAAGRAPVIAQFIDSWTDATNRDSYTSSSFSLGAADDPERRILAYIATTNSVGATISTIQVAGATPSVLIEAGQGNVVPRLFALAHVPSGTTGTVTFNSPNGVRACVGLWRISGVKDNTAFFAGGVSGNPAVVDIPVIPTGGTVVIGANSAHTSHSESGYFEDFDVLVEGARSFTGGHLNVPHRRTGEQVVVTGAGGTGNVLSLVVVLAQP